MTFFVDGNRLLNVADSHSGLSLTLSEQGGMNLNVSLWNDDVLHVVAQTMAAAGDRGIPITVPASGTEAALAWALLLYGYSTGDSYEKSLKWVKERAGQNEIDETNPKWVAVMKSLWP